MTEDDAIVLISWARAQGSGLGALVTDTRAHLAHEGAGRTLCGVVVPSIVWLNREGRARVSVLPNTDSHTARLAPCRRCAAGTKKQED